MRGKGRNGLLPNSLRIISSCLKTVSSNAGSVASTVRSAGASVAASITAEDEKDQVLWVGFDKLELGPQSFKHVLLLGYSNGFQVLNVEDASNFCELVSKRDGPVTFLQMQPIPAKSEGSEGFRASHPLLLVVAGDETNGSGMVQGGRLSALIRENTTEPLTGNGLCTPTVVRFYSLKSHSYVHVLRFRSAVFIVRCSPRVIAVALAAQIYCFDAVTLENKFSILTYPLQGAVGVNIGYGPMSVGPRWLAYTSNNPLLSNIGCLSPQNLTPSPGVSPSTSPGSGSLVARYAMESSKQLASGLLNLGDMGYKTLSKYCHELLPEGSDSPSSSNSCRRLGRFPSSAHPSEADNAGIVVVKDFVSKDVISQFRAHTSPISALCFDPSGTLLVTASVHGHNINIFRILPVRIPNGSSSVRYDWTSSHVHLYKLYRGLTTAVIQDICFSDYSQWISIISSRGTCHIFTLSPFGGDASLQQQSPNNAGPILTPNLSPPWWSCSSCTADQQFLPPPPVTLSVISRIKNGNSGWLSTVSNAAASATGKITVPSGALAAVFHNSIYHYTLPVQPNASALERLLVYSPSGHVIQHELLPFTCVESSYSSPRTGSGPLSQLQDDDLRVNAEPVQWWNVCRRSNWPERDENISLILHDKQNAETVIASSDYEDSDTTYLMPSTSNMAEKGFLKPHERHNWYLSNAEVQINSGRIPIWEKPKICFYMMVPLKTGRRSANIHDSGEIEIEKVPFHEVEIRRKELLPVFEQFHSSQANWSNRGTALGAINQASSSESREARGMPIKDLSARHSKPTSYASESIFGTCEPISFQLEGSTPNKYVESSDQTPHSKLEDEGIGPIMSQKYYGNNCASPRSEHSTDNSHMDECVINHSPYSSPNCLPFGGRPVIGDTCSSSIGTNSTSIDSDQTGTVGSHSSPKLAHYFQESYCKVSEELDDCRDLTGVVTDADSSSSHCEKEKVEEGDGDNDDMLGGVFAFSEEG